MLLPSTLTISFAVILEKCGARPTFLGYGGFPGSACISVNDQVIHGIPSADVVLKEGDIVKIDVEQHFTDLSGTVPILLP